MDSKTEPASEAKELKPCPFCESKAEWINETLPDGHYYIRCPHCHIVMKEDRRDKAIGMWNRREEITRLKAELERERELRKELVEDVKNKTITEVLDLLPKYQNAFILENDYAYLKLDISRKRTA